jgi:hypothetical protein
MALRQPGNLQEGDRAAEARNLPVPPFEQALHEPGFNLPRAAVKLRCLLLRSGRPQIYFPSRGVNALI